MWIVPLLALMITLSVLSGVWLLAGPRGRHERAPRVDVLAPALHAALRSRKA